MAEERPGGNTAGVDESVLHLPSDVIKAAADDPATADERSAAGDKFVADQARSGRLVDLAFTNAAVVNGVATVWEHGVILTSVKVKTAAETDSGNVVAQGFEVIGSADPSTAGISKSIATVDDKVATGLGLGKIASWTGGKRLDDGVCTTISKNGNDLTSCFELFKAKTSSKVFDYYYRNRFATAVGEETCALCSDPIPHRIDLRTKVVEVKGGDIGLGGLVGYWPITGTSNCDTKTFAVGVENFSASVPISDCEDLSPEPGNHSMRLIYDQGTIMTGRVHGIDMGMAYKVAKQEDPVWADYTYAKFCKDPFRCNTLVNQDANW